MIGALVAATFLVIQRLRRLRWPQANVVYPNQNVPQAFNVDLSVGRRAADATTTPRLVAESIKPAGLARETEPHQLIDTADGIPASYNRSYSLLRRLPSIGDVPRELLDE